MIESTNIEDLPLSGRLQRILRRNGCMTLGDILGKQPIEFKRMYGFGPKQFTELYGYLNEIKKP